MAGVERIMKPKIPFLKDYGILCGVCYLFYRHWLWAVLVGTLVWMCSIRRRKKILQEQKKWEINLEFREGLQGIAAALGAGYALENAIEESRKDLVILYGEESVLAVEFAWVIRKLQQNQPVTSALTAMAEKLQIEDISDYVEIYRTARKSGGDLISITRDSARKIGDRIQVRREIRTSMAAREMEGKVMRVVPLGMILYFWICSPGFLDCLYQGIFGRGVMSNLLIVYLAAILLDEKMARIPV